MKVLFTIAGLHPESGGPSYSVPALAEALVKIGVDVEILSHDYGNYFEKLTIPSSVHTTFVNCSSTLNRQMQWTPQFKKVLRERCHAFGVQILHDTGLWLSTNHAAAAVARELKLPRIISPRGMLTKWSLRHKGWKKQIAWQLYQRRDMQLAQILHATSSAEVRDFRAAGFNQPIAVIPNGVEMPDEIQNSKFKIQNSERRTSLFLSRIHPKKGLVNLVNAWALARPKGWRMIIAGPDERGHKAEVQTLVRQKQLESDFEFRDAIEGDGKWNLFRSADLFVLPSHSENFGLVVAEALACGVPVITTRGTPWEDLVSHQCGWWIENRPEILADALRDAMNRTDEERLAMGKRGCKLVEEKYGWPKIAEQMKSVYQWMLGKVSKPDFIC